jgi:drug/metabolite transporter (DMT)-like permease
MNIGFIYAFASAITWGLVYAIDGKILASVSPANFLLVSLVVMAAVTLPFVIFTAGSPEAFFTSLKSEWFLIVVSNILAALGSFLIFSGIKALGAPTASVIEISYPFFVMLFGVLLFRSVLNIYFLAGALLVFIGSAIIIKFS